MEKGDGEGDNSLYGNGEARDDIGNMPRKIAVQIFSYLTIEDIYRCTQVSRTWKMITSSNVLWSRLNLFPINEKLTDKLFLSMIKKCRPYLKHLNVRGSYRLSPNSYSFISGCHNIMDLNLSDCKHLTVSYVWLVRSYYL